MFKGKATWGPTGPRGPREGETEENLAVDTPLGVSEFTDTELNGFIGLSGPVLMVGIDGGIIGVGGDDTIVGGNI